MRSFLTRLMTEEDGATMVEYALMVALIAVAAIGAVNTLAGALSGKFGEASTALGPGGG